MYDKFAIVVPAPDVANAKILALGSFDHTNL